MAQVAWTAEAQRWLRDIYDYIAADNPAAAERVALAIYDSVRVLQEHPRLGQRYHYLTSRSATSFDPEFADTLVWLELTRG